MSEVISQRKLICLLLVVFAALGIFSCTRKEFPTPLLREYDCNLPIYELNGVGDSMLPLFKTGDVVCYQPYSFSDIKAGNVIVFWRGLYRVAHVAVRLEDGQWVTKGVNVESEDEERIGLDDYVGLLTVKKS